MLNEDLRAYLSARQTIRHLWMIEFWNGSRVRGDLEKLVTGFAEDLYATLYARGIARHGPCPPRRTSPSFPGLTVLYVPQQDDIRAWRTAVANELAEQMAEGRSALRDKCLAQIARRPWLKTFAPMMAPECVAVDRHGIGLSLYASAAFDLARPSVQVRPLKAPKLDLDALERALPHRPRAKRR